MKIQPGIWKRMHIFLSVSAMTVFITGRKSHEIKLKDIIAAGTKPVIKNFIIRIIFYWTNKFQKPLNSYCDLNQIFNYIRSVKEEYEYIKEVQI